MSLPSFTSTMAVSVALLLQACTFGEDCPIKFTDTGGDQWVCFGALYETETGFEFDGYYYDEDGITLMIPASSEAAQQIVDDGLFVPHGIGTCEQQRGEAWIAFAERGPDITVACCEDNGCQWEYSPTHTFGICYPEMGAWVQQGMVGAIARLDAQGYPHCEELEPLAFLHDYVYPVFCQDVACEGGYKDGCGCRCYESTACISIDHWLGDTYFNGASLPEDYGFESICEAPPLVWDSQAYGSGAYVGSSCEFNYNPSPLVEPTVVTDIKSLVSCEGLDCEIDMRAITLLMDYPSSIDGTTFELLGDGSVEISECAALCQHVGGFDGITITGTGRSNSLAEFLQNGFISVNTDAGTFTFTLVTEIAR